MKKIIMMFLFGCSLVIFLVGCGSSPESDAKKFAELECEAQKLITRAANGDNSAMADAEELQKKADAFYTEMFKKYKSEQDLKKLSDALLKYKVDCK